MKIYSLFTMILTFALFSAVNLSAQTTQPGNTNPTTMYQWPATQPSMGANDPFNINKVHTVAWKHSESEGTATDKIYRAVAEIPTSQGPTGPHTFQLDPVTHNVSEGFEKWGTWVDAATFEVDEDMNIRVHSTHLNKDFLLITDQIMNDILTVRDITGQ